MFFGNLFLICAVLCAFLQAAPLLRREWRSQKFFQLIASRSAVLQFFFVVSAFALLVYGFVSLDFSIELVARHANNKMPMLYRLTAVWGNHEGSFLLWTMGIALFGAAFASVRLRMDEELKATALAFQGLAGIIFYWFIIFFSNPFQSAFEAIPNSGGLNPLLQDMGLIWHPPLLYMGHAGLSVVYALALAALLTGKADKDWARGSRPWVLISWSFLTLGVAYGSFWAYYELGWGGWWFWDPVENVALMPWLVVTALLHCLPVAENRGLLMAWSIILSIIAFSLSVFGTFVVRSGLLVSVHAFSLDPTRGHIMMVILAVFILGGSLLFLAKMPDAKDVKFFSPFSRESVIVINNFLLFSSVVSVFLGTLFPLFFEWITGDRVSVGAPYFSPVFAVFMTPLLILLPIGVLTPWIKGSVAVVCKKLWLPFVLAAITGVSIWHWQHESDSLLAPVGVMLAVFIIMGSVKAFWEDIVQGKNILERKKFRNFLCISPTILRSCGRFLAHAGVGVMVIGISCVESWKSESLLSLKLGETSVVSGYEITLRDVEVNSGSNFKTITGVIEARGKNSALAERVLYPERRLYWPSAIVTKEVAILKGVWRDIYVVLGERNSLDHWTIEVQIKPFVRWIWMGAIMMAIGGLLAARCSVKTGVSVLER